MSVSNETCKVFLATVNNIDGIRCFFANFAGIIFDTYKIGYVNIVLTSLIILISIFGKFKENYRWFILNQAFWDLLSANEYNCTNLMKSFIYTNIKPTSSCFFNEFKGPLRYFGDFLSNCMFSNSFPALLLLSFSRFLVFYYENIYDKLTKKWRIFWCILCFNIFVSLIHLTYLFYMLQDMQTTFLKEQCKLSNSTASPFCFPENDSLLNLYKTIIRIFQLFENLKDTLSLYFTTVFAAFLGYSIIKTFIILKNPKTVLSSVRISFAIILQISVTLFLFSSKLIMDIPIYLGYLGFEVLASDGLSLAALQKDPNYCKDCIKFQVPLWMESRWGLKSGPMIQATRQCRVFLDSIIVLLIMTGYREAIVESIKFVFFVFKNPKKAFSKLKNNIFKNKVTVLSGGQHLHM